MEAFCFSRGGDKRTVVPNKETSHIRLIAITVLLLSLIVLPATAVARQHHSIKHHPGCNTVKCDRHIENFVKKWKEKHCKDEPIFAFFRKRLTSAQAAGIVGNTMQESENNPYASGGGLIQGQGGRTCCGSLHEQLRSIWAELKGPYRSALRALRRSRSPESAARAFSDLFERPGIPNMAARERYARESFAGRCKK